MKLSSLFKQNINQNINQITNQNINQNTTLTKDQDEIIATDVSPNENISTDEIKNETDKTKDIEISINGCVIITENPITVDEFTDKFLKWLESNNWCFGGGISLYREN